MKTTWKQVVYDTAGAYREATGTTDKIPVGELANRVREGGGKEDLDTELTLQETLLAEQSALLEGKAVYDVQEVTLDPVPEGSVHEFYDFVASKVTLNPYELPKAEGDYVWRKLSSENGDFIDFVINDNPEAYPNGGMFNGFWYEICNTPAKVVTWAGGTDAELLAMITEAQKGYLKLSDYWAIGDVRTIPVTAMSATGVGESQSAQNVQIVITEFGGKTLEDGSECILQYDFKDCLSTAGYINSSNNNTGGYESCARKTWLDNICFAALPVWLRSASRRFKTQTYNGGTTNTINTGVHNLALRTEGEIFGARVYSHANELAANSQITYYKTTSNRVKKLGIDGSASSWWTGSAHHNVSSNWCIVTASGGNERQGCSMTAGIAPYGCI